jgi:hypothetical protein
MKIKLHLLLLNLLYLPLANFAQPHLQARSQYTFYNNIATLEDSTLFYFSSNNYQPFISRMQTDWDSLRADSIVQINAPINQHLLKFEKQFNTKHEVTLLADYDRVNSGYPWKKNHKREMDYDSVGNNILLFNYNGSGTFLNVWNPSTRTIKDYYSLLQMSPGYQKWPVYLNNADYDFATSSWHSTDSNEYHYNNNLVGGDEYHDFGTGMAHVNHLFGIFPLQTGIVSNYKSHVNASTSAYDSTYKSEIYYLGPDEDSVVDYAYINSSNTWQVQSANYHHYYPGTFKSYSWRNYVYSLSSANHLVFSQGNFTDFYSIGATTFYNSPAYFRNYYPNYNFEKTFTYQSPFTNLSKPIKIVENKLDNTGNVTATTTDSLFYDANNLLVADRTTSSLSNMKTCIVYEYTSDGQLQKESLLYFDTITAAYVLMNYSYVYNFYYGNNPNSLSENATKLNSLSVYPNPAQDEVHICNYYSDAETDYELFDIFGNKLKQMRQNSLVKNAIMVMDIHDLSAGLYLLIAKNNQYKQIVRILKN